MINAERPAFEPLSVATTRSNTPTWRYLGERDAADRAYCTRFGVPVAPEPNVAHGGVWAYTLPERETTS